MEVKGLFHLGHLVPSTFWVSSGSTFRWTYPWNCLGMKLLLIPKGLTHHWQGSTGSNLVPLPLFFLKILIEKNNNKPQKSN